ncbi:Polyketide cyclase / dehydrase and lipid transport [Jannaschia faecimaris]|uniref:Polyketide cyclase / dehydrase and lipid transport n=1 Tax=Jannaschia faecimaris TaxID=1244108 RepID=A0A1H3U211_9RHOB|nr:SRPBCC family protein [Jannaschia faecimaris]SDZ56564.1 Polyketide cyclase / dehydrase and lipid transport [Jannaschia faecimaris]
MPQVVVKEIVNASVSQVWASWDDFGNIEQFNPNLKRSFLIAQSASTGLGATRQCDLSDGKNYIRERIIEYIPGKKMVVDIYDGTIPLKSARAEIELREAGRGKSEVIFTMNFVPKMGLLGLIMVPLMKPEFRKQIGKLLDGNRAFVERNGVPFAA